MEKIKKVVLEEKRGIKRIAYFIGEHRIAIAKQYSDFFCTVSKGDTPSNIRTKVKKCREFIWDREGLISVIGHSNFTVGSAFSRSFNHVTPDFMDSYPDTTWGDAGHIPSTVSIQDLLWKVKNKKI